MAKKPSLSLFFLSSLIIYCSGTLMGFSYPERGHSASSSFPGTTFLQKIKISKSQIQFSEGISKYLEARSRVTKKTFPLSLMRRTLQDTTNSPTTPVLPTNPTSPTTPAITPPNTPTIITVPSTNPVTVSPTTPVPSPPTTPGAQPVTNPVTSSYPPPSPLATLPLPPPNTNTQGQSWCVAKTGVSQTALQSALDYACGMPSVDCSQIQQSGTCYNPSSLQNHASFAFNSYYQKNPAPTSCDFGGTATIVSTNPSSGSCVYPSSSGAGTIGSGTQPSILGSPSPSNIDTSHSAGLRPFLGCMVLVISLVTGRLTI